jgi:hypothetical protein
MKLRGVWALVLCLALAACTGDQNSGSNGGGNSSGGSGSGVVQWERNPDYVIFRAAVEGGPRDERTQFVNRNDIPVCSVYGDNRIVWLNDIGNGLQQVLFDTLTDQEIETWVEYLTLVENIYNFDAGLNNQPPQSVDPIYEVMTIHVNGVEHRTDAFGGWETSYFGRIVNNCRNLATEPTIFEPDGVYLSAMSVPLESAPLSIVWDASAAGVRLADLAVSGERRWITDARLVGYLWTTLREVPPDSHFNEDGLDYLLAVEVPNVTIASPQAP